MVFPGGVFPEPPPKNNPDYAEVCQEAKDELSPQTPHGL